MGKWKTWQYDLNSSCFSIPSLLTFSHLTCPMYVFRTWLQTSVLTEELFLYTHTHIYMLLGEILPNQINKGDRVWELLSQMILGVELWAVLFEWYHNSVFLHLTTWYMPLEIFNLKTVQYRIPWWKVYSAYIEWTGIIDCGLSFPGLFYA